MARQQDYAPPRRKEPGLIGKLLSTITQAVFWLIVSLVVSILIEWVGMTYWWPEQREQHAFTILESDKAYLQSQQYLHASAIKHGIVKVADDVTYWFGRKIYSITENKQNNSFEEQKQSIRNKVKSLIVQYRHYILAAGAIVQIVVIRLVLLIFSLSVFIIAVLVGAIDGLVERDLRRWGGGRESSNIFNLSGQSIKPTFTIACVIYISLPYSISIIIVVLPFAVLCGFAVQIALRSLKKYF